MREYARGFIGYGSGAVASAVIKGLTPGSKYAYNVYMQSWNDGLIHEGKVTVNHDWQWGRARVTKLRDARFAGVAVATTSGEIVFKFTGKTDRVHLSGIAIARVGPSALLKPIDPPSSGMVAWYKSEDAGSLWPSSVGGFMGRAMHNGVFRKVSAGFGADRPVTYIQGDTSRAFRFDKILTPLHTVCSVTRYVSENQNRILTVASPSEWLHGNRKGYVGVARHNDVWLTESAPANNSNVRDWVVMCGTNGGKLAYDSLWNYKENKAIRTTTSQLPTTEEIFVNKGDFSLSDFAVMELITWDRKLSKAEMWDSMEYLMWKLRAGAVREVSEHLSPFSERNFVSFAEPELSNVQDQSFQANLANGYTATMLGWIKTRAPHGFVRNADGKATAVVSGLKPAAMYVYQLHMRMTIEDNMGKCRIVLNHGPIAFTFQGNAIIPRFEGVAKANPRGELHFEATRLRSKICIDHNG